MIHDRLLDEVLGRTVQALGAWEREELVGVSAWRLDEASDVTTSILIAVRYTRRHQGIGRTLKQRLIDDARAAGTQTIVSHVHWDNEPMLTLNQRLHADIRRDPGNDDYAVCILTL
jgi:predicted GNAT superfamily acetyltransferase